MRMIDKDSLIAEFACRLDDSVETFPTKNVIKMIEAQMEEEAIPISVIKRGIQGFSAAISCDQGGSYSVMMYNALKRVLEWYGTPDYQQTKAVTEGKTVVNQYGKENYHIDHVDELFL